MKNYYSRISPLEFEGMLKERNIKYVIENEWMHRFIFKNSMGMRIAVSYYKADNEFGYIEIHYGTFNLCVTGHSLDVDYFNNGQVNFTIERSLDPTEEAASINVGYLI